MKLRSFEHPFVGITANEVSRVTGVTSIGPIVSYVPVSRGFQAESLRTVMPIVISMTVPTPVAKAT